jgi:hypothetical protein
VHDHAALVPSFAPTDSVGGHDPEATPAGSVSSFPLPTSGWQTRNDGEDPAH